MIAKPSTILASAAVLGLFAFPKAGVYLGGIPFAFSYALIGIVAVMELIQIAVNKPRQFNSKYIWLGVGLLALAVVELYAFKVYGAKSLGMMVSVFVSTIAMPVLSLLAVNWILRTLGTERMFSILRICLAVVFTFGIVSFFAYNLFGFVLGVPFLTTTGADISLVAERHNLRGPIIKMFSTYNNGNILGINLLLWGPVVAVSSARSRFAFRSICLLTLSRSVWVGLLGVELLGAAEERSRRRIFRAIGAGILFLVLAVTASWMIGRDPTEFLLDKDLGGRITSLQNDLEVVTRRRISWDSESVPAAAWLAFGPLGLLLIPVVWMLPILTSGTSKIQTAARISMVVYLIVSCAEGAFVLIPTQATYWFMAGLAMAAPELIGESGIDQIPSMSASGKQTEDQGSSNPLGGLSGAPSSVSDVHCSV